MKALYLILFLGFIGFQSCHSGQDRIQKQTDQNYTIGVTKMGVKDYKGAIAAFSKCIALNANNYDAYHQKALAYKELNDKKHALYNYKMAQLIMEKHEDLTDPNKHAEYQTLLQEIKDYTTAPETPATTPPAGNTYTPSATDTARD
jgi:Tfp pilus assembly protein PilF